MARGGYNPEAEEAAKKDRAAAQVWLGAEAEALAESSARRRSAEAQAVSGPPGARHVADAPPVMSMETDEGLRRVMEREEQLMSVEPEGATTTSGKPGVALSGAAARADAAPAGGAGLTSGVDSVIYRLRKVQKAIESSTGEQKAALEAHAEVLKGQVEEEAGKQQEMADRADRRVRGMELMAQRHDEATARAEEETRNAERMVTSHEIDPNRAFKTTGARVGSAIAIAMSALGQGMSGRAGPNTAYKIIDDAINRDIDIQKEELRTRKDVLRNKNNLYANMMAKFGNERSAELATANAGIAAATQSLQALKATHKSQNAHLVIDEQIAKLEADSQKKKAELLQVEGGLAVAKMNAQARASASRARGSGGRRGGPNDPATMAAKVLKKLPILEQRFDEIGYEGGVAFFPEFIQGLFPGVRSYEASRNRVAKEITRAFDGGRPTEKDFAVIAMGMPKSYESRETGSTLFRDLTTDLTLMLEDGGTLQADESPLYAAFIARGGVLSEEAIEEGQRLAAQANEEDWEFFKAGQ